MKLSNCLAVAFLLLLAFPALSQEKRKPDSLEQASGYRKSYGSATIQYSSDWVYAGRKDSLAAPYITPSIGYYDKSGFFIRGFLSYLTAPGQNRVDVYGATAGYLWIHQNFYVGGSGTAWLFNDSSYAVQSAASGNVNLYAGYDFNVVDLTLDATALFSNTTDFLAGAELSRLFYAAGDRLRINPTVYAAWGTQYYYGEYYTTRSSGMKGRRGQGSGGGGGTQTTVAVSETNKFQLLAFELSMPVSYTIGSLRISFTPCYAIPQSPATITIDQTTYPEVLKNTFYWRAGISYKF